MYLFMTSPLKGRSTSSLFVIIFSVPLSFVLSTWNSSTFATNAFNFDEHQLTKFLFSLFIFDSNQLKHQPLIFHVHWIFGMLVKFDMMCCSSHDVSMFIALNCSYYGMCFAISLSSSVKCLEIIGRAGNIHRERNTAAACCRSSLSKVLIPVYLTCTHTDREKKVVDSQNTRTIAMQSCILKYTHTHKYTKCTCLMWNHWIIQPMSYSLSLSSMWVSVCLFLQW